MIKDRVFQKRIKGKVLAMAMTAVMASLFVPLTADAAEDLTKLPWTAATPTITDAYLNTGDVVIQENCSGSGKTCQGHVVAFRTGQAKGSIVVQKGHHYIKLEGADIISEKSVIQVQDGAEVTVAVQGKDNQLQGGGAGIAVSPKGKLTIQTLDGKNANSADHVLKVKSTGIGAGIGGSAIGADAGNAGEITIESGTIVAQGGNRSAGIGGTADGTVKSVKINGGIVLAKGGDGIKSDYEGSSVVNGAPGIGSGNDKIKGKSELVINGGQVTAIGGMNHGSDKHASGIVIANLNSISGGATAIVSDGIDASSDTMNGLVWNLKRKDDGTLVDKSDNPITDQNFMEKILDTVGSANVAHGSVCTVHGNAEIPPGFEADFNVPAMPPKLNELVIPTGTSLRIPLEGFNLGGVILGSKDSTLINPGKISYISKPGVDFIGYKDMSYKVSFSPDEDLTMKNDPAKNYQPFVYKGEAYQYETLPENDIFVVATSRKTTIKGEEITCPVDRVGLKVDFEWLDKDRLPDYTVEKDGIKEAGKYKATFRYGTTPYVVEFSVEPLDISNSEVSVSQIPNKDYKGEEFTSSDFSADDLIITYNGGRVAAKDYSINLVGQINAGDAEMTIIGTNNFTGKRKVNFKISPLEMNKDNTVVELKNGGWSAIFN